MIFYTLSVDFCHSCLFNSKIDMCAFLFASVSFIRGSTTFRIVSSLVLKRCLLHVWKIYNWLISVVIWPWRWWLNSPDLGPLSLFFHTLGNKVTCGPRLMKHTTFLVAPHLKSAFEAYGTFIDRSYKSASWWFSIHSVLISAIHVYFILKLTCVHSYLLLCH